MKSVLGWLGVGLVGAVAGCDISAECLPWFKGPACLDTDLGKECSADKERLKAVTIKPGSNNVVNDPGFDNCDSFYCASTNGSRPYCTKKCESNYDCNPGGVPCEAGLPGLPCRKRANWNCEVVIEFGSLACATVDPQTQSCELDENTGKVKHPAKYCRAKDGTLPLGSATALASGPADAGP